MSDLFMKVFQTAIAQGRAARSGMLDYPDEDGLLRCAACHERIEFVCDTMPGYKLPVACACIRRAEKPERAYQETQGAPEDRQEEPDDEQRKEEEALERLYAEARARRGKHDHL